MSAFEVDKIHIDALLTAGLADPREWKPVRWKPVEPPASPEEPWEGEPGVLTHETADRVGAMLIAENRRSVEYRYSQPESVGPPYTFKPVPGVVNPVVVLKAIACYCYQACEHPGWKTSEAFRVCEALRAEVIELLPGHADAPWEITSRQVFIDANQTQEVN